MNRIVYLGFRCSYIIYAFVSYSHWFSFRISVGAAAIAGICFITSFSLPLSLIFPCAFSQCWSQFFWYLRRLSKQRSQKKKIGVQHNTIEKWSKWKWFAFFRECKTIWKNFSSTNFCMGMCLHQIDLHTRLNRTKLWNKANQRQAREKNEINERKSVFMRIVSYFLLFDCHFTHPLCFSVSHCLCFQQQQQQQHEYKYIPKWREKRAQYLCKCDSFLMFTTSCHFLFLSIVVHCAFNTA